MVPRTVFQKECHITATCAFLQTDCITFLRGAFISVESEYIEYGEK